jgi:hypothetical protein
MATFQSPPKYRSLTRLLDTLSGPIARGDMRLSERWRDDEQALGFELPEEPGLSAYIYTYGQPTGMYGIELAFPEAGLADMVGMPLNQENLDLAHLISVLGTHFDLRVSA